MNDPERDVLIEQLASAFRARDAFGKIQPDSAFFDLDAAGREQAFDIALQARELEAALDEDGLSSTAHAVLRRIRRR